MTDLSTARVFLIDREAGYVERLRAAFAENADMQVVGTANSLEAALSAVDAAKPDVVVADLGADVVEDLSLIRQVKQRCAGASLIALVAQDDDAHIFLAINAGAAACVRKDSMPEFLPGIVRSVHAGEYPIQYTLLNRARVAAYVLRQFQDMALKNGAGHDPAGATGPLSRREMQVLTNVAQGKSNKEIAFMLKISEQTVKNHITAILRKLDANDRTHAVVMALRQGWISLKEEGASEEQRPSR